MYIILSVSTNYSLQVLSARQLPKLKGTEQEVCDPSVTVSVHGIREDIQHHSTQMIRMLLLIA